MMDKTPVAAESPGLSSPGSNDSNIHGWEGDKEDGYRCHMVTISKEQARYMMSKPFSLREEESGEDFTGFSEIQYKDISLLQHTIPAMARNTHLILDFYDY